MVADGIEERGGGLSAEGMGLNRRMRKERIVHVSLDNERNVPGVSVPVCSEQHGTIRNERTRQDLRAL